MKRWAYLRQNIVRSAAAGLVVGAALGLFEALVLVVFDLPLDHLPYDRLLYVVVAYGALGLLGGLGLGLLRNLRQAQRDRDVSSIKGEPTRARHTRDAKKPYKERPAHIGRNLVQGMGAGLIAGTAVGVTDALVLAVSESNWQYVAGLPYAVGAYGALGLLGGLGLSLLWGLWCTRRDRSDLTGRSVWIAIATLIFALGTFLVVHWQIVHHRVLLPAGGSFQLRKALILDGILLVGIGLGVGLVLRPLLRQLLRGDRVARITQARWSLTVYGITLVAAALLSATPGPATSLTRRLAAAGISPDLRDKPNVVFIVADALRADWLGCYDHPGHLTPHVDALARDGVVYRYMSAQASWTKPSVATMLTSLYPSSHQVIASQDLLPDDALSLPEVLCEQGYRTAGFSTNAFVSSAFNYQQGFDEYTYLPPSHPLFANSISQLTAFAAFGRSSRAFLPARTAPGPGEAYQDAAVLNQHALAWLEASQHARFFLYLHYMDPHAPYYAHPYDGRVMVPWEASPAEAPAMRHLYDGEVAFLDTHLGMLFEQLKTWELYDDTLIVFTADHGTEFQEHGGWGHGPTLYEEVLAVPLIVKYPGGVRAGTVDEGSARSLDLAPTILDMIEFPIPATMQGASLWPGSEMERAESVFAETNYGGNVVRAIRTRQRKLIIAAEGNPRGLPLVALFDLETDPGEQRNLAADGPDTVRALLAELDRVIAFAEAHAVAGQSAELDPATEERLRQLGY